MAASIRDHGHAARQALCERIVSCPIALDILHKPGAALGADELRCAPVVLSQLMHRDCPPAGADDSAAAGRWLVPEPWNGRLGSAPLLFIGQNPSASFHEDYPSLADTAPSATLHPYFESRFDGTAIREGTRVRLKHSGKGSEYAPANDFLSFVLRVATLLHGRPVKPGSDYALTEGVRCKSKDAIGVNLAVGTCSRRYMRETLAHSPAQVIVCIGATARLSLLTAFACPMSRKQKGRFGFGSLVPLSVLDGASEQRQVLFLRHPAAFGARPQIDAGIVATLTGTLAGRRG